MGIKVTYRKPGTGGQFGEVIEQIELPDDLTEIIAVGDELTFVHGGQATCVIDVPDSWVSQGPGVTAAANSDEARWTPPQQ